MSEETATPESGTPAADPGAPAAAPGAPAPAANGEGEGAASEPKTLAEGGGTPDERAPAPAFAENWREVMAAGDKEALKYLSRFNNPNNVFKSWLAASKKIGAGEHLAQKPDESDPEALNAWRAGAGIPEKPEGYLDKLPDGLVIGEQDQEMAADFLGDMHAADAPPKYVHSALQWYHKSQEARAAREHEADRAQQAENEDILRQAWGADYRPQLNNMRNVINAVGGQEVMAKLFGSRMSDGRPLFNDAAVLQFFAGLAQTHSPIGTMPAGTGASPRETVMAEKAQLEAKMKDTRAWHQDKAGQARYRDILLWEEKQGSHLYNST